MTNAWSALAPCPRSGGLFHCSAVRQWLSAKRGQQLKIASWNINSVRARLGIVERLLREEQPDILCLQETKVTDDDLPGRPVPQGSAMCTASSTGQKMHHGVAILSRVPTPRFRQATTGRTMARRATSAFGSPCGLRLENVYVPAGGDIPDRTVNPKFGQKLDFIERMTRWSEGLRESDAHRRRFQRRAARMRRVEPQGVARRRQPYADRGRCTDPPPAGARLGRHRPPASSLHRRATSPGGAIARPTGPRTIAAGGSTICGSRRMLAERVASAPRA